MPEPMIIRTLKDIERIEAIPWQERLSARTTYDLICQGAALDRDAPAIVYIRSAQAYDQPQVIRYREFLAKIRQTANLLHDLGIGPTDVISLLLPSIPQTHYALWGGQAAGIVHPVNPLLEVPQIIDLLRAARTKVLVALGPSPGFAIWEKAEAIRRELPDLQILRVAGDEPPDADCFEARLAHYPDDCLLSGRQIAPDDIAAYFATGGTTGAPKLAQHTHLNEAFEGWVIALVANRRADDVVLSGLPLFHVNAVHIAGLSAFAVGCSVVMLTANGYRDKGVIQNFWKIAAHYKATTFNGVPTLFASLLNVPREGCDIRALRYVRCGAAPASVALFRDFEAQTGIKIIEGYGLTEGSCSSTANPLDGERRIGSVGLRYPYQQIRAVQLDEAGNILRDCAPDEIGQIIMRGPHVTPGYLQAEHNRGLWAGDGWLITGDLGRLDADGYLWITGRAKDLIIRGGHNIDPAMVEEALHSHPAVALAAAVGRPDAYAGEVPVAYVQLKPGISVSEAALLDYARQHITERAAAPKAIYILDALPQTAVGKLFKPALRQDAAQRAYREALADLQAEGIGVVVEVAPDPATGLLATVHLSGVPAGGQDAVMEQVRAALDAYTIPYQVVWLL
jgi:fatty-acyl-CoA synthase